MRNIYLILTILGTILPLSQLGIFLFENGFDEKLFWQQMWINRVSSFFVLDVLVSAGVLMYFMYVENRKRKIDFLWIIYIGLFFIGVSCALPLFLFLREIQDQKNIHTS